MWYSFKNVANILLITVLFLFIFAVIGVQLFQVCIRVFYRFSQFSLCNILVQRQKRGSLIKTLYNDFLMSVTIKLYLIFRASFFTAQTHQKCLKMIASKLFSTFYFNSYFSIHSVHSLYTIVLFI